jgi:phage shock protein B
MDDLMGYLVGIIAILSALTLVWLIFHYVTRWKLQATLTREDENLMDELYELARRLDDRIGTVERIMTAENPNWRSLARDPATTGIEAIGNESSSLRSIGR